MQEKRNGLPARHELKYFINPAELEALRGRLRPVLSMDRHCVGGRPYVIRSLYFDDIDDSAWYDKQAGVMHRDKYRIRIYRYSDKEIFLERKRKLGDLIQKSSVQITRRLCDQLVAGDPTGCRRPTTRCCRTCSCRCAPGCCGPGSSWTTPGRPTCTPRRTCASPST